MAARSSAPREPRPLWEGTEPPSGDRVGNATFRTGLHRVATDYDRACDVNAGAGVLLAGDGWVVVITASAEGLWHPASPPATSAVAVGIQDWNRDSTPETITTLYASLAGRTWTVLGESVPVGDGGVALLHAGGVCGQDTEYLHDAEYERSPGERGVVFIGDAIVYPIPVGKCRLEAYEHVVPHTAADLGEHAVWVRFIAQS